MFCEKHKLRVKCWQSLKLLILQRKDEISLNANVTKVERN